MRPLKAIDDEFEFEEPVIIGGGGGFERPQSSGFVHPKFKHHMLS